MIMTVNTSYLSSREGTLSLQDATWHIMILKHEVRILLYKRRRTLISHLKYWIFEYLPGYLVGT